MNKFREITAKFASQCPLCHGELEAGETVLWKKGNKARHAFDCLAGEFEEGGKFAPEEEYNEEVHGDYGNYCEARMVEDEIRASEEAETVTRTPSSLHIVVAEGINKEAALAVAKKALKAAGISVLGEEVKEHGEYGGPVLYFP